MNDRRTSWAQVVLLGAALAFASSCRRQDPAPWREVSLPVACCAQPVDAKNLAGGFIVRKDGSNVTSFSYAGRSVKSLAAENELVFIAADAGSECAAVLDVVAACRNRGAYRIAFLTSFPERRASVGRICCFAPTRDTGGQLPRPPEGVLILWDYRDNDPGDGDSFNVIQIQPDRLILNGQESDLVDVDEYLRQLSERNLTASIVFLAAGNASFSQVIEVLDLCCHYHLCNLSIMEQLKDTATEQRL